MSEPVGATCPVLVTGGAGYIGSHAVLALKDVGRTVAVLDSLSAGHRWAVPDDVPFYQGDIGDKELLLRIFREQGIGNGSGAVMHCAGVNNGPDSLTHPLDYYEENTGKSCTLLRAAVEAQVPHFIFSSTAAVYGLAETGDSAMGDFVGEISGEAGANRSAIGPAHDPSAAQVPVSEDCLCRPMSPFGRSKLMTEAMLADTARAHPMNYCALRYFNVAGADPDARSGQSAEGAPHLIKVAVEAALGKRPYVSIFGTEYATHDGTAVRDYIHVSDLAQALVLALDALIENQCRSLVLNCGYGRGFSVLEVLEAVERVSGQRIEKRMELPRPAALESLVADNSRITATLPWKPRHDDLDTIVRHAMAWERRLSKIRGA